MHQQDTRPLLPFSQEKVAEIKILIMLELFGPPPPGSFPSEEMIEEIDRELLRRFRLFPDIYCPN